MSAECRRYVLRVIGHGGRVVGQRYALSYQAIDKLAAVVIPQAEALRLFGETGGNTQAVLAPMAGALKARGYDTLMVLPAQAQVVELYEVGRSVDGDALFDEAKRFEVESAKLIGRCVELLARVRAYMERHKDAEASEVKAKLEASAHELAAAYVAKG